MKTIIVENARELLDARLKQLEAADPSLKKRADRFAARLLARQARKTAELLARPNSKAYRDYILVP